MQTDRTDKSFINKKNVEAKANILLCLLSSYLFKTGMKLAEIQSSVGQDKMS
jgi:hypothetical protein